MLGLVVNGVSLPPLPELELGAKMGADLVWLWVVLNVEEDG